MGNTISLNRRRFLSYWLRLTLAILLLMFALSACYVEQDIEQPQNIASSSSDAAPALVANEDNEISNQENLFPNILQDPLFDFDTFADLPKPPAIYHPELQVIPLTQSYTYMGDNQVYGPVAFINSKLEQVDLPDRGSERDWIYYVLEETFEEGESVVYGYVYYDDRVNNTYIYVDVSGAVFTDFYPQPIWGADMAHYDLLNGYLITAVSQKPDGYKQLCGVMDLRTLQDVLPPQYDAVSLDLTTIWAIKDGVEFLFDYSGNLLMQSMEFAGAYESSGIQDLEELWNYEEEYRTLYLPILLYHDSMIVAHAPNKGLSVFTETGIHLLSIAEENIWRYYKNFWSFNQDIGKIIVRLINGDLVIVFADGQIKQIQLPADIKGEQFYGFSYETDTLTITDWNKNYAYNDETGFLTEYKQDESIADSLQLYKAYGYYTVDGPFITAYKGEWGDFSQIDILNAEGETILEDVFYVNNGEPSFPGTVVVWLNGKKCVLLDQNGDVTPIPPYTEVELVDFHY